MLLLDQASVASFFFNASRTGVAYPEPRPGARPSSVASVNSIVDIRCAAGEPEPARLTEQLFAVFLVALFERAKLDRSTRHRHVFESKIE